MQEDNSFECEVHILLGPSPPTNNHTPLYYRLIYTPLNPSNLDHEMNHLHLYFIMQLLAELIIPNETLFYIKSMQIMSMSKT